MKKRNTAHSLIKPGIYGPLSVSIEYIDNRNCIVLSGNNTVNNEFPNDPLLVSAIQSATDKIRSPKARYLRKTKRWIVPISFAKRIVPIILGAKNRPILTNDQLTESQQLTYKKISNSVFKGYLQMKKFYNFMKPTLLTTKFVIKQSVLISIQLAALTATISLSLIAFLGEIGGNTYYSRQHWYLGKTGYWMDRF